MIEQRAKVVRRLDEEMSMLFRYNHLTDKPLAKLVSGDWLPENGLKAGLPPIHPKFCNWLKIDPAGIPHQLFTPRTHQFSLNKSVDITIEKGLGIAGFHTCSQILDT